MKIQITRKLNSKFSTHEIISILKFYECFLLVFKETRRKQLTENNWLKIHSGKLVEKQLTENFRRTTRRKNRKKSETHLVPIL